MRKEELEDIFRRFGEARVLIIGDVMLDKYVWGKVDRISPEAPVPVVTVVKHESRLGGAANVALNIKALGATPVLAACLGKDEGGISFLELLRSQGLPVNGIIQNNRATTVKTRIIGNNHQLLRVDEEDDSFLEASAAAEFQHHVLQILEEEKIHAIIFEDYDKGLINSELIERVVMAAEKKAIPVAVDPKRRNFSAYKNVTLFKPNLKEIREGLKLEVDAAKPASIIIADQALRKLLNHDISLVTLSEHGVFAGNAVQSFRLPAHLRNIADVSGAGDTVISIAALCLAVGTELSFLALLSNLAGGIVCEKVGVVPINAEQLLREAMKMTND